MTGSGEQIHGRVAVSWQAKFTTEDKWGACSKEHFDWVRAHPAEFVGYEVRELFDTPASIGPAGLDACPITGLPFYGNMLHPEHGMLAMYGGPFDVYSIPMLQQMDGELRRERYDLDADCWIEGGEPVGFFYREQQPDIAAPNVALADISLAAQMLTWGRDEGLTESQVAEIDAHAQRIFDQLGGQLHACDEVATHVKEGPR